MLLDVDVGNTQTHLGAFRGEELVHDWRFATVRESTADELGADATVIATGGMAATIAPLCENIDEVDPYLTLRGLRLIWERNR